MRFLTIVLCFICVSSYAKQFSDWELEAQHGDPNAQLTLSVLYAAGEGVNQDHTKAFEWATKSADQGNPGAYLQLGNFYTGGTGVKKDYVEAAKWYRKAVENGDYNALFSLGYCYEEGKGVRESIVEAYAYYTLGAIQLEYIKIGKNRVKKRMTQTQIEEADKRSQILEKEINYKILENKKPWWKFTK
jgi:TPR repeat protein